MVDFRTSARLGPLTQQHHYGGFSYQCSTWPTNPTTSFWWIFVPTFNLANSLNNIVLVDFRTNVQLGKLTQQHRSGGFSYQRSTWQTHPTTSFWWIFVQTFNLVNSPNNITMVDFCTNGQLGPLTRHEIGRAHV